MNKGWVRVLLPLVVLSLSRELGADPVDPIRAQPPVVVVTPIHSSSEWYKAYLPAEFLIAYELPEPPQPFIRPYEPRSFFDQEPLFEPIIEPKLFIVQPLSSWDENP